MNEYTEKINKLRELDSVSIDQTLEHQDYMHEKFDVEVISQPPNKAVVLAKR